MQQDIAWIRFEQCSDCDTAAPGPQCHQANIYTIMIPLASCGGIYILTTLRRNIYSDHLASEHLFWPPCVRMTILTTLRQNIYSDHAASEYLFWPHYVRISILTTLRRNICSDHTTSEYLFWRRAYSDWSQNDCSGLSSWNKKSLHIAPGYLFSSRNLSWFVSLRMWLGWTIEITIPL